MAALLCLNVSRAPPERPETVIFPAYRAGMDPREKHKKKYIAIGIPPSQTNT